MRKPYCCNIIADAMQNNNTPGGGIGSTRSVYYFYIVERTSEAYAILLCILIQVH